MEIWVGRGGGALGRAFLLTSWLIGLRYPKKTYDTNAVLLPTTVIIIDTFYLSSKIIK